MSGESRPVGPVERLQSNDHEILNGSRQIRKRAVRPPGEEDGGGTCHIATLHVAVGYEVTAPAGTAVPIDVLANDIYDDVAAVAVQVFPQYGSLGIVGVGVLEYTPFSPHPGTDSFTYQLCNTASQCDTATATITAGP